MDLLGEITDEEDFLELIGIVQNPRLKQTFRERPNHFTKWNDRDFKLRFRLSKPAVRFIIDQIKDVISSKTDRNHALTTDDMMFLTLRFLATGCFLRVAGDLCGVDKSTASRVIHKVLHAIATLKPKFINMPKSEEELLTTRQGFYNAKFPKCIGAIDCTHIRLQSPGGQDAETYRNRKGFFSLNVQVVGDSKCAIRNIVCRWPGSSHDSNIFRNSRLRSELQNGHFGDNVLVGDSGYGVKSYLITPLLNPRTEAENLFNEAQIRTRNPIERLFGIWKRRFPILALGIRLHISKVEAMIIACAVLHNIAVDMNEEDPLLNNMELEAAIIVTNNVNNFINQENNGMNNNVRYTLINQYFQHLL